MDPAFLQEMIEWRRSIMTPMQRELANNRTNTPTTPIANEDTANKDQDITIEMIQWRRSITSPLTGPSQNHSSYDNENGGVREIHELGPLILTNVNPFVWPDNKAKKGELWTNEQYTAALKQAMKKEQTNQRLHQQRKSSLRRAAETHLDSLDLVGRRIDEELKRIAEVFIFRFGSVTNDLIKTKLNGRTGILLAYADSNPDVLTEHQSKAQCHTLSYLRVAMQVLVANSGGVEAWKESTEEQKERLLSQKFMEAPMTISKACFRIENNAIDFEGIWGKDASLPECKKWRTAIHKVIVCLAMKVWQEHTLPTMTKGEPKGKAKKVLFAFYKKLKQSQLIEDLGLGSIDDVPTRPSRSETGRRTDVFNHIPEIDLVE